LGIDQPHEADLQALDACLTALEQIDRNANLGLVIQNWCEELNGFSGGIAGQNRSPALTSVSRV
jgi:hypothetical protein